ncbi:MAG: hypothetical protein ACK41D_02630 [Rubricoccaceae bacterium]
MGRACATALLAGTLTAAAAQGLPPDDGGLPPLPPDSAAARFGASRALSFGLSNYGLSAGGVLRGRLTDDLSVVLEVALSPARDEREQQFFVGFFGDTVVPFKRNYVALVPFHAGLEARLLRRQVTSNFRPFVVAASGPTLAVQWPYFRDDNGDGIRQADEERLGSVRGLREAAFRLGAGGTLAAGAYLGHGRTAQGLRIGYTAHYFRRPVDLLELDERVESPSRRFFGTPTVSFHVVRLLP